MADQIVLDGQTFYQKIQKIVGTWNQVILRLRPQNSICLTTTPSIGHWLQGCPTRRTRQDQWRFKSPFNLRLLVSIKSKANSRQIKPKTFKLTINDDYSVWLLNYEFSETILLITKDRVIFAVSPKKSTRQHILPPFVLMSNLYSYRATPWDYGTTHGLRWTSARDSGQRSKAW